MSVGLGTEPIEVESVLLAPIQEVEVPAQEAGLLQRMPVAEGAMVKQGDLLAQIDDTDAKLQKTRAEIELDNAAAERGQRYQGPRGEQVGRSCGERSCSAVWSRRNGTRKAFRRRKSIGCV